MVEFRTWTHGFRIRPHALKQNNASLFGICVYNKNILHIY